MAILVDNPHWPKYGRLWCHLVSDESFDELHEFAREMGIPERGFGGDHYDLPEEMREKAIAMGAVPTSSQDIVRMLRRTGMRKFIRHQP